MNRFGMALAASLLFSGAAHADSVRIHTSGKSDAELKAQVAAAAVRLCRDESAGSLIELQLRAACAREAVRSALTKSQPSELAQLSNVARPEAGAR